MNGWFLRLLLAAFLPLALAGCGAMLLVPGARGWVALFAVLTIVVIIVLVRRRIKRSEDD